MPSLRLLVASSVPSGENASPLQKFPLEDLSYRTRIALLFFIEGSLGLMTGILQGKLDPADFTENHNAINDNMPEVLRRYFE